MLMQWLLGPELSVACEGEAVRDGSMDVCDLAPALLAVGVD
jgi:hypothetical protein